MKEPVEIRNADIIVLALSILAGIILRFFNYAAISFTPAEAEAAKHAAAGFVPIIKSMYTGGGFPLFHLSQFAWASIFGWGEGVLRFIPVILGIVNIFIMQKLTRTFFSDRVATAATILFAISPFQAAVSAQALDSSLCVFTGLLTLYYFLLSMKYNQFLTAPYTLWGTLAILSGPFGVLLVIALSIIYLIRYREELRINLWAVSFGVHALFIALLVPAMVSGASDPQYATAGLAAAAPLNSIKNFLLGSHVGFNIVSITVVVVALYMILMGVFTRRHRANEKLLDIAAMLFGLMIIIPWIMNVAGVTAYSDRGLALAGALLLVLVSAGSAYLAKTGTAVLGTAAVIIIGFSVYGYYTSPSLQQPDCDSAYRFILENAKEGDVVLHDQPATKSLMEYMFAVKAKNKIQNMIIAPAAPEKNGKKPAGTVAEDEIYKEPALQKRVWFISTSSESPPAWVNRVYWLQKESFFKGMSLRLLVRK